jgi:uncharacterized LabA/DUF88 family protein
MIKQFIKRPVHVFIDAENLFYTQRTLKWLISYEKLMKYFREECGEDCKIFVYTGIDENNNDQRKFLDMLTANGFIVRTRTVKKFKKSDGRYAWKNNLDMELAFEMVETKEKYQTAVLISGDGDFAVPIVRIKNAGKRIIVMSTRGHISIELLELAKYIDLRKLKEKIKQ